ncbi:hypothetical protein [Streptomyces humi]
MTEHTRLLAEVSPVLKELSAETRRIRKGEIAKPVREIAPLSLRVHELAVQCTRQVHDLSVSQYPAMEGGAESLAHLAGACAQISLAATLCNLAIHHRDHPALPVPSPVGPVPRRGRRAARWRP